MLTSKFEIIAREYLKYYFPNEKVVYNNRPDFLINDKTGRPLELDIWYPELKFAVEVNGLTHKLKLQKGRDELKKRLAQMNGFEIITISNPQELLKLRFVLRNILPRKWVSVFSRNVSKRIRRLIREYRPNLKAFNNLHQRVTRAISIEKNIERMEYNKEIQMSEVEKIRARRLAKEQILAMIKK